MMLTTGRLFRSRQFLSELGVIFDVRGVYEGCWREAR